MTDDPPPAGEKAAGAASLEGLRVFISYAHKNYNVARSVACHLKKHHATVLWDRGFVHGSGFHEQIKTQIAYAHVFMPLITASSSARGWVHEEIGYAMALNVPVLPVAIGKPPEAMLYHLHAVWFDSADDLSRLEAPLPPEVFLRLMERFDDPTQAIYVCAAESEERAAMLYRYATEIRRLGHSGKVRQSSALSSFHIPAETPEHPRWELQYGPDNQCSLHHRRLLRCERLALEWHASEKGAKLVVCPEVIIDQFNRQAAKTRLQTLKDFLERAGDKVEVARRRKLDHTENITIVGDWFMAASVLGAPQTGYRQTIFTRHTPTIRERIALFDLQFEECGEWPGTGSSRERAIAYLRDEIDKLRARGGECEDLGGSLGGAPAALQEPIATVKRG